jgi:hypothetical protein
MSKGLGGFDDDEGDPYDENWKELRTTCGRTTTTRTPPPQPSPKEANPMLNEVHCYKKGRKTDHQRTDNTALSACKIIGKDGDILPGGFSYAKPFELPVPSPDLPLAVEISFDVFQGCQWKYDLGECLDYFKVPIDGCNCGGVNGKQGGWMKNDCVMARVDPNNN